MIADDESPQYLKQNWNPVLHDYAAGSANFRVVSQFMRHYPISADIPTASPARWIVCFARSIVPS